MRAIILAAGVGKRIGGIGLDMPKCLIEIAGRSLLSRHLENLYEEGIKKSEKLNALLSEARNKVMKLVTDEDGTPSLDLFEGDKSQ